ncbi:MAG: Brp/Blh family beta-carotene 15,15'-dioxygenase [Verrucomicrobiota bacterium]
MNWIKPGQEGLFLSWFFFALGGLAALVFSLHSGLPWLPFLISLPLIGMAHGAGDWIILKPVSPAQKMGYFLAYSAIAFGILALAWFFPTLALCGFLLLTILHFGSADERDLQRFAPDGRRTGGGIWRIGLFFSLTLALHPTAIATLGQEALAFLRPASGVTFAVGEIQGLGQAGGLVFACLWAIALFLSMVRQTTQRALVELGEGLLLLLVVIALHPLFSVGLYFLTWHAFRHTVELAKREIPSPNSKLPLWQSLFRVHRASLPFLLPVIFCVALVVAWRGSLANPFDWTAVLLLSFLVLTLPHHFLVERWWKTQARLAPASAPEARQALAARPALARDPKHSPLSIPAES